MIWINAEGNTLHIDVKYEEISYKEEFNESKYYDYFNIGNAEFISYIILRELFDISKEFCMTTLKIIDYLKKDNIKKVHIYLYPKTGVVKIEKDILGIETERHVDMPEYGSTISNLLYKFDRNTMHWFDHSIQNVLKVIDRDKIKVIYHFNQSSARTNCHGITTTNDEIFVKTIHQNSVYYREW